MLESCSGIYHKISHSSWPGCWSEGPASFTHSQDITGKKQEIAPEKLVCYSQISRGFGSSTVSILLRRYQTKLPMARPNDPDMSPKHVRKVGVGICFM